MWYYRLKHETPFSKKRMRGVILSKEEWAKTKTKIDFGNLTPYLEVRVEPDPPVEKPKPKSKRVSTKKKEDKEEEKEEKE